MKENNLLLFSVHSNNTKYVLSFKTCTINVSKKPSLGMDHTPKKVMVKTDPKMLKFLNVLQRFSNFLMQVISTYCNFFTFLECYDLLNKLIRKFQKV